MQVPEQLHVTLLHCCAGQLLNDWLCMQSYTAQSTLGDAMLCLLKQLPRVQWIITTLGKRGSVLVEKTSPQGAEEEAVLEDALNSILTEAARSSSSSNNSSSSSHGGQSQAACISKTQAQIR